MLNNLTNFFNLIAGKRVKTTANPDDLITLGVRDPRTPGIYQPAAIKVSDLVSTSGVTSVTGTAPVVSSGGSTPAISMPAATTLVSGHLTSTDFNTFNNKQAALVSGTNIKTINGNTLLGSGDLTISGGSGNRLATHILTKPQSQFYYSLALTSGNLNQAAVQANVLQLLCFTPAYDLTINTLILQITTAFVGGLAKVAIYSDLDGVPHTKLFESVDVSTDTTGSKTITGFSFTFTAGTTYWISTIANSASIGFRTMNALLLMTAVPFASSQITQVYTCWTIAITYASLPTTLTTPTVSNLGHASYPHLVFRSV